MVTDVVAEGLEAKRDGKKSYGCNVAITSDRVISLVFFINITLVTA